MAAPKLPFYYYHLPAMSGAHFLMIDFLRAAAGKIPTLAGIKFTNENLMDYAQCLDFEGGLFDMLFGRDEILLAGLALGARGAVGSTYNYAAGVSHRILSAFGAGNLAQARLWQARSREIVDVMIRCGGQPAGKAMMKLAGIDCGPCRRPLGLFTAPQYRKMVEQLKARGLLKWFSR
jgi:N-acetylneuraminate lyase